MVQADELERLRSDGACILATLMTVVVLLDEQPCVLAVSDLLGIKEGGDVTGASKTLTLPLHDNVDATLVSPPTPSSATSANADNNNSSSSSSSDDSLPSQEAKPP